MKYRPKRKWALPDLAYWYNLKDQIKRRCHRLREYCLTRDGDDLHHRHYHSWGS
jgi:hypothetical protein